MDTAELSYRGGARLGIWNSTWPFARLTVTTTAIVLKVRTYGTLTFTRDDIIGIEPYRSLPIVGEGVRIHHSRRDYPEKVIFWWGAAPAEYLAKKIQALGYAGR